MSIGGPGGRSILSASAPRPRMGRMRRAVSTDAFGDPSRTRALHEVAMAKIAADQKGAMVREEDSNIGAHLQHSRNLSASLSSKNSMKTYIGLTSRPHGYGFAKPNDSLDAGSKDLGKHTGFSDFVFLKPIAKGAYGRVFLAAKRSTVCYSQIYAAAPLCLQTSVAKSQFAHKTNTMKGDRFAIKVLSKAEMVRRKQVKNVLIERSIMASTSSSTGDDDDELSHAAGASGGFVVPLLYSFQSE